MGTSALAKLVAEEAETAALRRFLANVEPSSLVTSALTRAELLRAASRHSPDAVRMAREVLGGLGQVTITEALLDRAGCLAPPTLRTLDVIHLATALELGGELRALVAYDARLLDAAHHVAVPTVRPT
jgi:uncharacterized protein